MTDARLGRELTDLRNELREARETLDAIRTGDVDALVLGSPGEERVFALAGADRPYRLLVDAMHEGAATVSAGGTVLYANAGLGELVGRTVDLVVGTPAMELAASGDRAVLAELLAVGVGEHAEGEVELVGPEGAAIGVLLSVVAFELDGTLLRSLVATDLTARRRAEQELRDSEYFFRESQRAANIGSYRFNFVEDRWVSSEVLDRIFGIDERYPRTVGGWADLIHPDDRAAVARYLRDEVIGRRQPFRRKYRIVRRNDGETRWVSGLGEVMLDPDGNVAGLTGTIMDVTERTIAESERKRLFAAIENSAEAVVITNLAAEIEYVDPAFERITGYSRDDVLGSNPRILQSGAHGPEFYAGMWEALTGGRSFTAPFTNRRKDGTLYQEESVISPILDESGSITSYVAVKRDVTRELEAEANQQRLARGRALIASTLAEVRAGPTPEATGEAICRHIVGMAGITTAAIYYFDVRGQAVPLAFVRADGKPVGRRPLPAHRSRTLPERSAEGPWVETWVHRPWHPLEKTFSELGVTALAIAPIRDAGQLFGFASISTDAQRGDVKLAQDLAALLEFAGFAGALVGSAVAGLTELRGARARIEQTIRYKAFRPVFQPIVEIRSGAHVGYEALTRFTDGRRPDLVFAEARTAGLEAELELATLAAAVGAAAALPRTAWLSLNVSPALAVADRRLGRLLRGAGRPIVLEITEHAPVEDYDALRAAVARIRPKVRIAVDDAGAGVANLNHIAELRPAFVKLDVSLIRGIDADRTRQALIVGLLRFADESGATAVAEGVESQEELAMLRELGVRLAQGYLLAHPAPVAEWVSPDAAEMGSCRHGPPRKTTGNAAKP